MNVISLIGRLGRDVELRHTDNGLAVLNNCLAVPREFSKNDETDWIEFSAFGKTAEFISNYFGKGNKIAVTGRLQIDKWKDNDGNMRTSPRVIINTVDFCESKTPGNGNGNSKGILVNPEPDTEFHEVTAEEDDNLPF